jgi:SagB-type dehydrogenase family enzyme
MRKSKIVVSIWLCLIVSVTSVFAAEQAKVIALPAPRTEAGMPLMQALKTRSSTREFSRKDLSLQTLSDLLWAGFGISRADGKRTAPSARNMQEIDIYVAKAAGLFRYNAKDNALELIIPEDIREATGKQDFVKTAPINLIYVADLAKTGKTGDRTDSWVALDTGFIAENVYLFCASEGLATVVRGMFDSEKLAKTMRLKPDQKIILTQTIGYKP